MIATVGCHETTAVAVSSLPAYRYKGPLLKNRHGKSMPSHQLMVARSVDIHYSRIYNA